MFRINKKSNEIEMTRGDTAAFQVCLVNYRQQEGDVIVMTIKKKLTDSAPVLTKNVEDGVICFSPDETKDLLGTYVYDIQVTTNLGAVYTPIQSVIMFTRGVTE